MPDSVKYTDILNSKMNCTEMGSWAIKFSKKYYQM